MAVQIVMPRLGDFMTEGIVARWAKGQGDAVAQGELIAEIESEKLNYELEATSDGILHHAVDEGATVGVDDVIGYLLAEGEEPPQPQQAAAPAAAASSPRSLTATTRCTSRCRRCRAFHTRRPAPRSQPRSGHLAGYTVWSSRSRC